MPLPRHTALLLLFALLCESAMHAAGVTIVGPSGPIRPGSQIVLTVSGLTDSDLADAVASVEPANGVTLIPAKTWGGAAILIFSAIDSGVYTVSVSSNSSHAVWRHHIDEGVLGATAARIEPTLLGDLTGVSGRLAAAYPAKSGSYVILVDPVGPPVPPPVPPPTPPPVPPPTPVPVPPSPPVPPPTPPPPVPPPTPPPVPPVPITTGTIYIIVIRQPDMLSPNHGDVLRDMRQWSDEQPLEKVAYWEFAPDAIGPDGKPDLRVKTYLDSIPAGETHPYVFILRATVVDGKRKGIPIDRFRLPSSADVIIKKVESLQNHERQPTSRGTHANPHVRIQTVSEPGPK